MELIFRGKVQDPLTAFLDWGVIKDLLLCLLNESISSHYAVKSNEKFHCNSEEGQIPFNKERAQRILTRSRWVWIAIYLEGWRNFSSQRLSSERMIYRSPPTDSERRNFMDSNWAWTFVFDHSNSFIDWRQSDFSTFQTPRKVQRIFHSSWIGEPSKPTKKIQAYRRLCSLIALLTLTSLRFAPFRRFRRRKLKQRSSAASHISKNDRRDWSVALSLIPERGNWIRKEESALNE